MNRAEPQPPRGRLAPSPTGRMHLGNASSALLAWLSVRARGGTMILRIEDLDRGRARREFTAGLLEDLEWMGLDWDEGPYEQSGRVEGYAAAFERLRGEGRVYPCFCSRRDVAAAASAPQAPGDEVRYPGRCRGLDPAQAAVRVENGERHAWRFRDEGSASDGFADLVRGRWGRGELPGDFVVWRSDDTPAYQLAVVVDDAAMGVTEVVRGEDLLASTVKQLTLYDVLDLPAPRFGHVPLLLDGKGVRLSKRQQGITLKELREQGVAPQSIVGRLAGLLGLRPTTTPLPASELVDGFGLAGLAAVPGGLVVETEAWNR